MSPSVGFSADVRGVKIPHEKQSLWSRGILELLKEGFIHFLTLIGWSVKHSHHNVTRAALSSDPEPQALIPVVHPIGELHTSELLANIEGNYPPHCPHCPCLSFLMNLYPYFTVSQSGKLSHPVSAILTTLYLCDFLQSSGSFYPFHRILQILHLSRQNRDGLSFVLFYHYSCYCHPALCIPKKDFPFT